MRGLHRSVVAGHLENVAEMVQIVVANRWNTATAAWLVPEPGARPAVLSAWYSLVIEQAVRYGYADLATDRRSAAIWIDRTTPTPALPDYLRRLTTSCGRYAVRLMQYERILERHRPRTGHAELVVLAADGQSAQPLLAYRHRQLDEAVIPAHAVTDDGAQTALLAGAGYRPVSACRIPLDGPNLTVLRRLGVTDAVPDWAACSDTAT